MTGQQEPYYLCYDGDFGLSGLAEAFALSPAPENARAALGLVTAKLDAYDRETPVDTFDHLSADQRSILGYDTSHDEWGYADDLRDDVRTLVGAPLSDEAIRTVWRVAAGGVWDPAAHGMSTRDWLRCVEETCAARPPRRIPGRRPAPSRMWTPGRRRPTRCVTTSSRRSVPAASGRQVPSLPPTPCRPSRRWPSTLIPNSPSGSSSAR
ncbi:hypothetical protein OG410_17235 [Streptomyces sp. NBC_00659]|uniref:hypothetical protein n=1 Tax=Streptomyces sp. NBC_00659 TaxID=2903669 RepID=UPI002E35095D|nr:hypothetical protein [Streptomyces sp. NBC_00659]